ncbi:MAG: hypothetical protein LRY76_07550 [Alphaproteobacteria bacterium]|nr:hypothetical protein [Alphaproteobacteria bacterium]
MAGPLSGITGQQVPFATTFKPGGNQQETVVQQKLDEASNNAVSGQTQTQGTESTSAPVSQSSESTQAQDDRAQTQSFTSNDNGGESTETRRGSILDIAV